MMSETANSAHFSTASLPAALEDVFAKSRVCLSLADYRAPDCPLIGVNQVFCDLTGYAPDEILGHNCRFLQPADGAGPVRERMRAFLDDQDAANDRFLVPNVTKSGTPFLNLIYMTKITHQGEQAYVLASQFAVGNTGEAERDLYDRTLEEDVRQLNLLTRDGNWAVLGTLEALASSHSIIVQSKLD